jgi:hypothetical protein
MTTPRPVACTSGAVTLLLQCFLLCIFSCLTRFGSYSYFTCEAAGTTTYGSNRRVQGIVGAVLPTTYTMTGFATSQNISTQHWSLAVIDCDGSIHAGSRMPTHISYYQYQPGIRKKLKYACAECENLLTPSIQNQDPGNHEYPRC